MKQIITTLLLFTLSLFANIPPQITYNDHHQPLVIEYENGSTILYGYDEVGNITLIETPTQSISKTYDALNHLSTVTDAQGTTTYTYDALGRQTQISYSNGMSTSYAYDSRNRITNITHTNSSGDVLQSFAYILDSTGNRTQIVQDNKRTVDYEYNTVNQLTKETVTNDPNQNNTTTTFTYDDVGNLVTKTIDGIQTDYTYNTNDQLETKGSISYTYDSNGNLVAKDDTTYEYDDKNRLIKVITPNDTIEYSYDANNNRIAKTTSNGTTMYLIDANTPYAQVITETKEDGTEIKYTYGNDLISDGTHSFLTDALGSTRGLVDSNESLIDSYAYTPYGKLSSHDGNSKNAFLFTGEQRDEETQNYYLRARYYSPSSSRFISRDSYDGTIDKPSTLNHYAYTHSNPMNYVDPSGHMILTQELGAMRLMGGLSAVSLVKIGAVAGAALFQLRANKVVYISPKYEDQSRMPGITSPIHHFYILAKNIKSTGGYRYDFDVENRVARDAMAGKRVLGFIEKSYTNEDTSNFVRLSKRQYQFWEWMNYKVYPHNDVDPNKRLKKYYRSYINCLSWTMTAYTSALTIMLTVPSL